MKVNFSKELYIAYAVCENCGNKEFIVSGQTQTCNKCKKHLFRTIERKYNLEEFKNETIQQDFVDKIKIAFPEKVTVAHAWCNTYDCSYREEVVDKEKVICQYCMKEMELEDKITYVLNHETFQCPICEYEGLYFPPWRPYETCPNCKFNFSSPNDKKTIEEYRSNWKTHTIQEALIEKIVCTVCGYEYDEKQPFDRLSKDYVCPVCGISKKFFQKQE